MAKKASPFRYVCLPESELGTLQTFNQGLLVKIVLQGHEIVRLPKTPDFPSTLQAILRLKDLNPNQTTIVLSPLCTSMQRQAVQLLAASGLLKTWMVCRWDPNHEIHELPAPSKLERNPTPPAHTLVWNRRLTSPLKRVGLRWLMEREFASNRFMDLGPIANRIGRDLDSVWILHPKDEPAHQAALRIKALFPKIQAGTVQTQHNERFVSEKQEALLQEIRNALRVLGKAHQNERIEFLIDLTTGTEEVKAALLSLALGGELPGKWIVGDGKGKEIDPADLTILIDAINKQHDRERDELLEHLADPTRNESLQKLRRSVVAFAQDTQQLPILLSGPTGCGKSHFVKAIAKMKGVNGNSFQHLNCSEFVGNADMLRSHLFGHVKGAHSKADEAYIGAFESAHGGILFLDEIGEMPLETQAQLLVALDREPQGYRYKPTQAKESRYSDFLLVCGTNRDLQEHVQTGHFREDLYHRISTRTVRLPSLHERLHETPPKDRKQEALELLERAWAGNVPFVDQLTENASVKVMATYAWPGNFREFHAWSRTLLDMVQFGRLSAQAVERSSLVLSAKNAIDSAELNTTPTGVPNKAQMRECLNASNGNNSRLYKLATESGWAPKDRTNPTVEGKRLREEWTAKLKS